MNTWFEELARRGTVTSAERAELYRLAAARKRANIRSSLGGPLAAFASQAWTCRDGSAALLWERTAGNLWTTVGATWLLNNGLTAVSTYLGLIAGATAPSFAVGDTAASHAGWAEVAGADVVQTSRPALIWGAASGGVVNNSASQITYQMASAMVGTRTLLGGFLIDNNSIGGTSGNLISEATFDQGSATVSANNTVTILVTVTILAG